MSKVVNGRLAGFIYPDQKINELCYKNAQLTRQLATMEEHELVIEIGRLQEIIRKQNVALDIARKVCGQSNCNCVGAKHVKKAVNEI